MYINNNFIFYICTSQKKIYWILCSIFVSCVIFYKAIAKIHPWFIRAYIAALINRIGHQMVYGFTYLVCVTDFIASSTLEQR